MEAGKSNQCKQVVGNNYRLRDGSPGLVVMGGDSCSEGCGFKSQHSILWWLQCDQFCRFFATFAHGFNILAIYKVLF